MIVKQAYPEVEGRRMRWQSIVEGIKWAFLFAGFLCGVINLAVGGPAWSPVVMWALWMVWTQGLSPDLVEYNRISQFIKFIVNACVLLTIIGVCLSPGWAVEVVPIVCFGGLLVVGVLLFTDFERQKQNLLPLILLIGLSMIGSAVGLALWREESRWALAVMGAFALCLLVACAVRLRGSFLQECKKRFCAK